MAHGATVVSSLEAALTDDETWVIGGAEVYHLALPLATRCEVTEVEIDLRLEDDDALAPMLDESWAGTSGPWQDSRSGLRYRFDSYLRA
jgi:dihydrofolate reductase